MDTNRIHRLSRICFVVVVACAPLIGYWAAQLQFGTAFVESWLPDDDPARIDYRGFRQRFGEDQFLLVSWPECTIDDPRLEQFTDHLLDAAEQAPGLAISRVENSKRMLDGLTAGPLKLRPQEAHRRLQGFAIGQDGTCFVSIQVAQAETDQRAALIAKVHEVAADVVGCPPDELVLAGEPYQVYLIDRSSREAMQYYVAPSTLIALLVGWFCLRGIRLTLIVFALAGLGQVLGMALVAFFISEMTAVLVVLPTLVFMLTLSAAIHLTNYYVDSGGDCEERAGARALLLGARPCILATLTTVFGFASLTVSQLSPVWQFGSLAALGLILSSLFLLTVFPAATRIGLRTPNDSRTAPSEDATLKEPSTASPVQSSAHESRLRRFGRRVEASLLVVTARRAMPITLGGITLLVFAIAGLNHLQTSTEFDDMFPERSQSLRSLRWVQQRLGPINSLEFLVSFPHATSNDQVADRQVAEVDRSSATEPSEADSEAFVECDLLAQLELVRRIHQELAGSPHVHSVLSATTFLPELPQGAGVRNTIRRAVIRRQVEANWEQLDEQGLVDLAKQRTWRITARVRDLRGSNFESISSLLLSESQQHARAIEEASCIPTIQLSGLRTVIEKAHRSILGDLGGSFVAAFILITPVMMIIVRSIRSGLILMIPNVLPVALVFGGMGWLGIKLDVASILTASVALGIAVDDTLHFMSWFLRGRQAGDSPSKAVASAVHACARPMIQTTVISSGAMLPFFFSDFLPTSKFALLMILILNGAIIGDLILLPALLQSQLGHWVGKSKQASR